MAFNLFFRHLVSPFYRCFIILIAVVCMITACGNPNKPPDVSKVKIDLKTYRFDLDLYAIDTNHIGAGLAQLKTKYPDFLDYFLDTVMAYNIHGNYNDTVTGIREGLKPFLSYKDFVNLEREIKAQYPDSKQTDEALTKSFRYMKYYFPAYETPRIIYLNMGLSNWPSFPLDRTTICVGLDMFLGDHFQYYKSIGVPDYMLSHTQRDFLPVSVFMTIYKSMHPFKSDDRTLLDLMVQRGKEQYFLHKVLPQASDVTIFGFTPLQLKWCQENEALIYNFFIHQNLLYDKESHAIMPYVMDGPFAKNLEASTDTVKYTPGNVGSWLGYRIVSIYAAQHRELTVAQIINNETDPAKLLDEAKYRPK